MGGPSSTRLLALLWKELHIGASCLETGFSAFHSEISFAFVGESTSDPPTCFCGSICFDAKARAAVNHASLDEHPYTAPDVAIRKGLHSFIFVPHCSVLSFPTR